MRQWLSIVLAAGLLLYPFAIFADDYGSQSSSMQQEPPVAGSVVREGDFAIKLAATLDLGTTTDESAAEDLLAKRGIAPLNGWLSDYPVTPQILGQLNDSVSKAAAAGKLSMTSDQATRGLAYLAQQMNLAAPAGASNEPPPRGEAPSPTVINNYYYDQGPPVITYYPPPYDYVYLYDWVPYPVWWFGFWFPGFFICHNFTTTVVVNGPVFVNSTVIVHKTVIVSNHVIDPVTRTTVRVDPDFKAGAGRARPVTALRAPNGRTFASLAEMRTAVKTGGLDAVRSGGPASGHHAGEFRTNAARRSAEASYSRSVAGRGFGTPTSGAYRGGARRSFDSNRPYGSPTRRGSGAAGNYSRHDSPGRPYYYNRPARGYEGRYSMPDYPSGRYNGGGARSTGPWYGSGWQTRGGYNSRAVSQRAPGFWHR